MEEGYNLDNVCGKVCNFIDYTFERRKLIESFLEIKNETKKVVALMGDTIKFESDFEKKENDYYLGKIIVDNEILLLYFLMKEELLNGETGLFDALNPKDSEIIGKKNEKEPLFKTFENFYKDKYIK